MLRFMANLRAYVHGGNRCVCHDVPCFLQCQPDLHQCFEQGLVLMERRENPDRLVPEVWKSPVAYCTCKWQKSPRCGGPALVASCSQRMWWIPLKKEHKSPVSPKSAEKPRLLMNQPVGIHWNSAFGASMHQFCLARNVHLPIRIYWLCYSYGRIHCVWVRHFWSFHIISVLRFLMMFVFSSLVGQEQPAKPETQRRSAVHKSDLNLQHIFLT